MNDHTFINPEYMRTYEVGESALEGGITHRATPIMRLLESRRARGSGGSTMRSHSWEMSAVSTERLGSFLKEDFAPRVAASL